MFPQCGCSYCTTMKPMAVWQTIPGYWVDIPMNASAWMREYLQIEAFTTDDPLTGVGDKDFFEHDIGFVVIRDPVDRFLATFDLYFIHTNQWAKRGHDFFKRLGKKYLHMTVNERFDFFVDNIHNMDKRDHACQFWPQRRWINTKVFAEIDAIPFHRINGILGNSHKPIATKHPPIEGLDLTPGRLSRIRGLYKEDYTLMNELK